MNRGERSRLVSELLAAEFPGAECELDYQTPWQLLVATVLSAQCTDSRVNQVTPELFRRWPGPSQLASAPVEEVESVIRPTGFFRNKARSLTAAAAAISEHHNGEVPKDVEALVELPGIGRKTANVVLGEAFGIPAGIAVDTHVKRVARRLGLTSADDPLKIEAELEELLPREEWVGFSMRMILHGRRVCVARKPRCPACCLEPVCRKVGV
ncbi:MAG: endonuclease III [Acidobacteria bacterium]|jgi:endonuclease-3|nr:endonuclease III [Acidobacteriota bacterium]